MVTQRNPRYNAKLTRINPPASPSATFEGRSVPSTRSSSARGWLGLAAVVLGLYAVGRCSSSSTSTSASASDQAAASNAQEAIETAVQAQSTPPVAALSHAAVARGLLHIPLATREGLAGEMIYSQNCYDALGRKFSWSKLDACGAFDAEAALAVDEDETAAEGKETTWFQSEMAASRFLKAATAAGEPAEEADTRWSALQSRVASKHKVRAPATVESPSPQISDPTEEPAGEDVIWNAEV